MIPSLAIVIVNWNSGCQLRQCLASIAEVASRDGVQVKLTVVDNASTDHSAESLGEYPFPLAVLREKTNLGFAVACNLGARETRAEYLLFLNPDTRLLPGSLCDPLLFLRTAGHERVGIVGIGLVDEEGRVQRTCSRFPSPSRIVVSALGLDRVFPGSFEGQRMIEWDHEEARAVDQVMGAFFLVRAAIFDQLEGFDERFFVYFEEVDFSLRADRAGWTSFYLPTAQAFHRGGGTTNHIKAHRLYYSLQSRILYAFKHFGTLSVALVVAVTLLVEPLTRLVYAASQRSLEHMKETLLAYSLLWGALPGMASHRFRSDGPKQRQRP